MASDITAPSKSREKVALKPGFHLSNWVKKLDGFPRPTVPLRKIPMAEIKLHNTEEDCWTIINGKVFDITEYIQYHPGGVKKLMMGAGRDCTALFNKYHAWVNIGAMVGKCCVGTVGEEEETLEEEEEEDESMDRDADLLAARVAAAVILAEPADDNT
jgi:cytochrome b involved in lipid metabolism